MAGLACRIVLCTLASDRPAFTRSCAVKWRRSWSRTSPAPTAFRARTEALPSGRSRSRNGTLFTALFLARGVGVGIRRNHAGELVGRRAHHAEAGGLARAWLLLLDPRQLHDPEAGLHDLVCAARAAAAVLARPPVPDRHERVERRLELVARLPNSDRRLRLRAPRPTDPQASAISARHHHEIVGHTANLTSVNRVVQATVHDYPAPPGRAGGPRR